MKACIKKELTEQLRTGRLTILGILFTLFGIMNPAVAKLTPWILSTMADSMAESGMSITVSDPTALDSWTQFFKNIPMALIAFVLIECAIFTREYQSGTLILSLTKGLKRYKVVVSKALMLAMLWSACYWLCYGITYMYNAYYWDNSVAKDIEFAALSWWIFGLFVTDLIPLFSAMVSSGAAVLGGVGAVVFAMTIASTAPKVAKYMPTHLMDGTSLIYLKSVPYDFKEAFIITAVASIVCIILAVPVFNRKQL